MCPFLNPLRVALKNNQCANRCIFIYSAGNGRHMDKITWFVVVLGMILSQNSAAERRPTFRFVSGRSFERVIPEAGPKDWKRSEIELIKKLLPKVHVMAPTLMAKAKILGQNQFARWESKVSPKRTGQDVEYVRHESTAAAVAPFYNSIGIFDAFFTEPTDGTEGWYMSHEHVLVHELAHVADVDQKFSRSRKFLSLAGFTLESDGSYKLKSVDQKEWDRVNDQVVQLLIQRRFAEAARIEKQFTEPLGFPSLYGMTDPFEALAEFTVHLIYDPRSVSYMRPEIVEFIRKKILPANSL